MFIHGTSKELRDKTEDNKKTIKKLYIKKYINNS